MPNEYPSVAPTPELAALFPSKLTDVEKLVYDHVAGFSTNVLVDGVPALNDPRAGAPPIPIVRGWPAYPGPVPAIGISAGAEGEDQQADTEATQFAGTVAAYDDQGVLLGTAEYYAEPLYSPIVIMLIHENRDERDRLHVELRRLLFPLRRTLPKVVPNNLVKRVAIDAERSEGETGPEVPNEPMIIYQSIFTVHVFHEMLEATNVAGPDSVVGAINVTVTAADEGS